MSPVSYTHLTDALEKARGITIFSKQALLTAGDTDITLLDTPCLLYTSSIDIECDGINGQKLNSMSKTKIVQAHNNLSEKFNEVI